MSGDDRRFMERALELAARGDWRVPPNPRVGAVIVREGQVLAEGFHQAAGGPHAEASVLAELLERGVDPRGSTLYVTLEPCGAFAGKRTPPCVDAVLGAGFRRVVVASQDPHPAMRGASLARLREAGVAVEHGLLAERERRLNGPFRKWVTVGAPYVTAKWAMSLDGKIAAVSGDSQWISGEASRRRVHELRAEVGAILVGVGTALADDPLLTCRGVDGPSPLRVVLDRQARLPLSSRLVQSAGEVPLVVACERPVPERAEALRAAGVEVLRLEADPLPALLRALGERGVQHLLVEGGGEVLASFFAAGCVDRAWVFLAPKILGGHGAKGPVGGPGVERVAEAWGVGSLDVVERLGADLLLEAHLREYGVESAS